MTKKREINRYECDQCGTAREGKTYHYYRLGEPIRGYTVSWDNGEPHYVTPKKGKEKPNPKRETKEWWLCSIDCVRDWSGGREEREC